MSNRDKIHTLLDLCLDIQENGEGKNGYPYIDFCCTNHGTDISILIQDSGFNRGSYDGEYRFDFANISPRTYENCRQHLLDLRKQVNACTTTNAPTAEHI